MPIQHTKKNDYGDILIPIDLHTFIQVPCDPKYNLNLNFPHPFNKNFVTALKISTTSWLAVFRYAKLWTTLHGITFDGTTMETFTCGTPFTTYWGIPLPPTWNPSFCSCTLNTTYAFQIMFIVPSMLLLVYYWYSHVKQLDQKKSVIQAENSVNDYARHSNMSMQPKTGCSAYLWQQWQRCIAYSLWLWGFTHQNNFHNFLLLLRTMHRHSACVYVNLWGSAHMFCSKWELHACLYNLSWSVT